MGALPTSDEMIAAVEQSGYLMEQQVADLFAAKGYYVIPNWPFPDQDLGISREVDVLCNKSIHQDKPPLSILWLLCECKNSTQPFVFIGNRHDEWETLEDSHQVRTTGNNAYANWRAIVKNMDVGKHHHFAKESIRSNQFCKIVRDKDKWKANHEGVFDSIILPLVKALEAHKDMPFGLPEPRPFTLGVYYPLVVTASDLYHLDTSSPNRTLSKQKWITLSRRLNSAKISGFFMIDFVGIEHLEEYIDTAVEPLRVEVNKAILKWLESTA